MSLMVARLLGLGSNMEFNRSVCVCAQCVLPRMGVLELAAGCNTCREAQRRGYTYP